MGAHRCGVRGRPNDHHRPLGAVYLAIHFETDDLAFTRSEGLVRADQNKQLTTATRVSDGEAERQGVPRGHEPGRTFGPHKRERLTGGEITRPRDCFHAAEYAVRWRPDVGPS